ncbi:hypothetical protein PENSPDRAFT_685550 [Peniophora sp. CONT]|nr:hypothetical protein PENSPDRAFT_685550 [Peniophora sp. CONT]
MPKRSRADSPPATSKSKGQTRTKRQKFAVRNGTPDLKLDDDADAPPSALPTASTRSFNDAPRRMQANSTTTTVANDDEAGYLTGRGNTRSPSPAPQREAGLVAASTEPDLAEQVAGVDENLSRQLSHLKTMDDSASNDMRDGRSDQAEGGDTNDGQADTDAERARTHTPTPPSPERTPRASHRELPNGMRDPSFYQPIHVPLSQQHDRSSPPAGREPDRDLAATPFTDADTPDEVPTSSQESNSSTSSEKREAMFDFYPDPDSSFEHNEYHD